MIELFKKVIAFGIQVVDAQNIGWLYETTKIRRDFDMNYY
jgi:hypothetical protein